MAQVRLTSAVSRRWLYVTGAVLLILIGAGLLYRQLTGNTIREQRLERQREKTMQELAAQSKPSAEAFSAKLEGRRLELERQQKMAQEEEDRKVREKAELDRIAKLRAGQKSPGLSPSLPALGDDELDGYELLRQQALAEDQRNSQRKMGAHESGVKVAVGDPAGGNPLEQLLTLANGTNRVDTSAADPTAAILAQQQALMQQAQATQNMPTAAAGNPLGALLGQLGQAGGAGAAAGGAGASNVDFALGAARRSSDKPPVLTPAVSPGLYTVHEGTAMEVAMLTAVSSDLPGPCRAQVVRDVFDSATGAVRLIPAGSRLICTYNSGVVQGQDRVFLAFTRLIYPSGASVALTAFEGADGAGAIGAPAEVNSRFWRVFGSSLLIAAVTHLAEREQPSSGSTGTTINVSSATSNVAANALADTAKASLQRNLNIKPELRLRPGDHLRVVVNRDMVLPPLITGTGALQ